MAERLKTTSLSEEYGTFNHELGAVDRGAEPSKLAQILGVRNPVGFDLDFLNLAANQRLEVVGQVFRCVDRSWELMDEVRYVSGLKDQMGTLGSEKLEAALTAPEPTVLLNLAPHKVPGEATLMMERANVAAQHPELMPALLTAVENHWVASETQAVIANPVIRAMDEALLQKARRGEDGWELVGTGKNWFSAFAYQGGPSFGKTRLWRNQNA